MVKNVTKSFHSVNCVENYYSRKELAEPWDSPTNALGKIPTESPVSGSGREQTKGVRSALALFTDNPR